MRSKLMSVFAGLVAAAAVFTACADAPAATSTTKITKDVIVTIDGAAGAKLVGDKVKILPDDAAAPHVVLVVHREQLQTVKELRLLRWFRSHHDWIKRLGAHPHVVTEADPVYRHYLAAGIQTLPAVLVQRVAVDGEGNVERNPDGSIQCDVLWKVSGEKIPEDEALAQEVASAAPESAVDRRCRRDGTCPQPEPDGDKKVDVVVQMPPREIPDTVQKPPADERVPWGLILGLNAAGLMLAAGITFLVQAVRNAKQN